MDDKRRILVVDDEESHRIMLRAVLSADGYEVAEASDGGSGVPGIHYGRLLFHAGRDHETQCETCHEVIADHWISSELVSAELRRDPHHLRRSEAQYIIDR